MNKKIEFKNKIIQQLKNTPYYFTLNLVFDIINNKHYYSLITCTEYNDNNFENNIISNEIISKDEFSTIYKDKNFKSNNRIKFLKILIKKNETEYMPYDLSIFSIKKDI